MLETVTGPDVGPLKPLVLDHLKLDPDEEEGAYSDLIDAYLEAAVGKIESASGRYLFTRSMKLAVDAFGDAIVIPASPVQASGVTVKYLDADGVEQTLAGDQWALVDRLETPRIIPAYGATWPTPRAFTDAVRVTFEAGYAATAEDLPAQLRMAVLQTVADWYRFGGNVATTSLMEIPANARRACMNFRREWA